jgi:hypothetical protein
VLASGHANSGGDLAATLDGPTVKREYAKDRGGAGVRQETRFLIVKVGFATLAVAEAIAVLMWMGLTWR